MIEEEMEEEGIEEEDVDEIAVEPPPPPVEDENIKSKADQKVLASCMYNIYLKFIEWVLASIATRIWC